MAEMESEVFPNHINGTEFYKQAPSAIEQHNAVGNTLAVVNGNESSTTTRRHKNESRSSHGKASDAALAAEQTNDGASCEDEECSREASPTRKQAKAWRAGVQVSVEHVGSNSRTWLGEISKESKMHREPLMRWGNRTVYTSGRPPWFDSARQQPSAFVIGICGGSASGKTTIARKIIEALEERWVSVLSMDSFYKVLSHEQHEQALRSQYNFDHPNAFDFELLEEALRRLKEGKCVQVPIYDFRTHRREKHTRTMYGANVVIFEGILSFVNPEVLKLIDFKVFVDTDGDVRLARRLLRDIQQRDRALDGVLEQYRTFVKPAYDQFIAPSIRHADIVIPWNSAADNLVAVDLIVKHVREQLSLRAMCLRSSLSQLSARRTNGHAACDSDDPAGANGNGDEVSRLKMLSVLQRTNEIECLHTLIRDVHTARDDFVFYSDRLMRLLFEFALSFLQYDKVVLQLDSDIVYNGLHCATRRICGVSIMRAGECMEGALAEVCKDVQVGKLLIQTGCGSDEPQLFFLHLPDDIAQQYVLLLDPTVATGAAAAMAIRILIEHDVPESNIMLCTLLMSRQSVLSIAYMFPRVRIVTTALDECLDERYRISPGCGSFGNRYFGTDEPDDVEPELQREIELASRLSSEAATSYTPKYKCADAALSQTH